jgi:hypothetical protein
VLFGLKLNGSLGLETAPIKLIYLAVAQKRREIMKSLIFLAPCLAAYAVSAFAQSSAQITEPQSTDTAKSAAEAQDPQKTSQPKTNNHDRGSATGGDKTRMVGCILGQDGKYILVTRKQSSVVKLNSAEDLKSYVGHKVKVTVTNNPVAIQSDASRFLGKHQRNTDSDQAKSDI